MKIGIIGAGLSGLTCAWYLKKKGLEDITIFESSEKAGGKLQSEHIKGFLLDRGFQVILPAYPEAKKILDYDKLQLQKFHKGSLIFKHGKQMPFYDPENGIKGLIKTILYGPGNFKDKLILLKLKRNLERLSVEEIFSNNQTTNSLSYLKKLGFSKNMINDFWIPFYQGVFLENNLETDSKMLQFTFKMFAEAGAAIPKEGMQAIPKQLTDFIDLNRICFNSKVTSFNSQSITIDDKTVSFDKVVLACNLNKNIGYHSVTNMYFETKKLPLDTKHIILNANTNKTINNVVMISNIAPNYAPNENNLISVSANGIHVNSDDFIHDLKSIFGPVASNFKLIKSYTIHEALPMIDFKQIHSYTDGVYYCGDHLLQGSINGAMESGRKVAEAIIKSTE